MGVLAQHFRNKLRFYLILELAAPKRLNVFLTIFESQSALLSQRVAFLPQLAAY
jgi:hypothetical protein